MITKKKYQNTFRYVKNQEWLPTKLLPYSNLLSNA